MQNNKKERRIELLLRLQNIPKVAEYEQIKDKKSLYRYFKRLEKSLIIENKGGMWLRTDNDKNLVELHNLRIDFKTNETKIGFLEIARNKGLLTFEENERFNQKIVSFKDIPNFIIRCMPDKITFQQRAGFQIRLPRSNEAIEKLYEIVTNNIDSKLNLVESLLNIKISKKEAFYLNVKTNHIAFVDDKIARKLVEKDNDLHVFVNGKERLLVDLSAGKDKPHFEAVHNIEARPDAKKVEDFYEALITDEFNHRNIVTQQEFGQVMNELKTEALQPLTEQLKLHLGVEQKQDINMDKMNTNLELMNETLKELKKKPRKKRIIKKKWWKFWK